ARRDTTRHETTRRGGRGADGCTFWRAGIVKTGMRFRYVVRQLIRLPMFTGLTIVTLALGIGANTAIFSVIEGVVLKPLPFAQPDELVAMDHAAPGIHLEALDSAAFLYFTYRDESRAFQDVGLSSSGTASVTGAGEP